MHMHWFLQSICHVCKMKSEKGIKFPWKMLTFISLVIFPERVVDYFYLLVISDSVLKYKHFYTSLFEKQMGGKANQATVSESSCHSGITIKWKHIILLNPYSFDKINKDSTICVKCLMEISICHCKLTYHYKWSYTRVTFRIICPLSHVSCCDNKLHDSLVQSYPNNAISGQFLQSCRLIGPDKWGARTG